MDFNSEEEEFEFQMRLDQMRKQQEATQPNVIDASPNLPDPTKQFAGDGLTSLVGQATQKVGDVVDSDFVRQPSQDTEFSGKEMLGSALVGAGAGAAAGLVTGGVASIPLAVGGAALGGISYLAGNLTKKFGGSEALALGAEIASGGIASLGKNTGQMAAKKLGTWMPYKERAMLSITGTGNSVQEAASKRVVQQTLGKKPEVLDYDKMQNQLGTQALLKKELEVAGKQVPENVKVSDYLRDEMYGMMQENPAFYGSAPYRELQKELVALKQRPVTGVNNSDIVTVDKTIRNLTSKNPNIAEKANNDLLNLVQNGGAAKNAQGIIERKISDSTQEVLKSKFTNYLQEISGGEDIYGTLKSVEKAEFVAKARDAIPQILGGKMKPKDLKDLGETLQGAGDAGKVAKEEFSEAFMQHLSAVKIPEGASTARMSGAFMEELRKLQPDVTKAGLLTNKEINTIQKSIAALPKNITKEAWRELSVRMVQATLQGAAGSQGAKLLPMDEQ